MKNVRVIQYILPLLVILALAFSIPATANYNYYGFFLKDNIVMNGKINGGVYVGGGHGLEETPYTEQFSVPNGTVKFARLYVHVWGTDDGIGWIDTKFNGESLGKMTLNNTNDNNPNVYCAGSGGTYWIYYDVKDKVKAGSTNTATVNTGEIYSFDGRVAGVVLIVVYENPEMPLIQYWIEQGLDTMIYAREGYDARDTTTAPFSGTVDNFTSVSSATFWTVYLTGTSGDNDKLWFNDQLLGTDVANGSSGSYFDLVQFNVTDYLKDKDNEAKYDRGDDNYLYVGIAVLVIGEQPKAPDLVVTDITSPTLSGHESTLGVVENHAYTVNATIKNLGNGNAGSSSATLYVNGNLVDTKQVQSLEAGKSATIGFTWTPTNSGTFTLNVSADSTNSVEESNENNNYKTKEVNVESEGNPDLELTQSDITFLPTRDLNETTIKVSVKNNGTGDANDFKVALYIDGALIISNTLSVSAKATKTTSFKYNAAYGSTHTVEIKLDSENTVSESNENNNDATKTFSVIQVRILATKKYDKNEMLFDIVKLVPEGTTPFNVLNSVADVNTDNRTYPYVYGIDGVNQNPTQLMWWSVFINGLPTEMYYCEHSPDYYLHDGEVIHWVLWKWVNEYKPRPVLTYPEPFVHGFKGTVWDTTIVYPSGYESTASEIKNKLTELGVPTSKVSTVSVNDLSEEDKSSDNLILLGTPSENSIISDINAKHEKIGMTVYFEGSLMKDYSTDETYSAGGVVEACDNPYDNAPDEESWKDNGPSIWVVSGVDKDGVLMAADLLVNNLTKLDKFWVIVLPEQQQKTFSKELVQDWNLISIPVLPSDTSVASVLSSIQGNYELVFAYDTSSGWKVYDPSAPDFANTLKNIDNTMGFWIKMKNSDTLKVTGTLASTQIQLAKDWNLIGYPSLTEKNIADALSSIQGNYELVFAYDTSSGWKVYDPSAPDFANTLKTMTSSYGYWIKMKNSATLNI